MVDWDKATFEALSETAPNAAILSDEVITRLNAITAENETLRENLDDAMRSLKFEDRGWQVLGIAAAGENLDGLSLQDVKEISGKIRPYLVAGDLMKRGVDLHTGYVWNRGLHIEGVDKKGRGAPTKLRNFYLKTANQESLFSPFAHSELQKARYADGNIFFLCDTGKNTVKRIPLSQITAMRVDPSFPEDVWAYRRTWDPSEDGSKEPISRWYYTKRFEGKKQKTFTRNGVTEAVEPGIIVDGRFNRQTGWALGVPDAAAAMPWRRAYSEFMKYGQVVNESLAKMLFKITGNKSKAGAANVAVKSTSTPYGGGAALGEGQDLEAVRTAGKGYEFKSGDRIAAMVAASLNVPNVELLSDSSAAGGSYGAAATLTPSTRNSMKIIQDEWLFLFNEVFDAFGIDVPKIWFDPIDAPDPYRAAQQLKLLSDGLFDKEYRAAALDQLDIPGDPNKIPELLAARNAAQTNGSASGVQQASPQQGVSNGSGGIGSSAANDLRSDGIGEWFDLDRFEYLIERFEKARNSE